MKLPLFAGNVVNLENLKKTEIMLEKSEISMVARFEITLWNQFIPLWWNDL